MMWWSCGFSFWPRHAGREGSPFTPAGHLPAAPLSLFVLPLPGELRQSGDFALNGGVFQRRIAVGEPSDEFMGVGPGGFKTHRLAVTPDVAFELGLANELVFGRWVVAEVEVGGGEEGGAARVFPQCAHDIVQRDAHRGRRVGADDAFLREVSDDAAPALLRGFVIEARGDGPGDDVGGHPWFFPWVHRMTVREREARARRFSLYRFYVGDHALNGLR
ncbi:hypothetical protein HYPGJ_31591 [Hyphomicrobium sp. GJ21]|nr:hypothetical protein HYPGJ_31591 [Hyphomicrobium sp. GJ21]